LVERKKSKFKGDKTEAMIRRFQESDFQDLSSMYREFFNEMREWQGWEGLKLDNKEGDEVARESLDSNSVVFVAENQKKLVGFARIQFWDGAYFVREVFVEKSLRRKGLGSKLLASCEGLVLKNGENSIYLTVEPKHSVSIEYLIHNGYDTLNMLELRKDLVMDGSPKRQDSVEILGHKLRLLKRNI
jgi:GNAT superfamily N-acetyltransferase